MKKKLITILTLAVASALGAAPSVNTPIGNTAKATYTDDSGVTRQVVSNTVVTRVSQVYALDLVNDNNKIATLGSQVYYSHSVKNEGNGPDTFTLAAANTGGDFNLNNLAIYPDTNQDGNPDNFTPITSSTELAIGESFYFVVSGTVPSTGVAATDDSVVTVTATSVGDNTQSDTNTDTVTLTNDAVMQVNKSISVPSGTPGTTAVYTITYTNNGNSTAAPFTITDPIPAGMTYTAGSARWSVSGATALSDATGGTSIDPTGIEYAFTAGEAIFEIASVAPGASGFVRFTVTVDADQAPGVLLNTADFEFTSNTTDRTGSSNTVPFTVIQVAGVTLTPPAAIASASAGATVKWNNALVNTGTGIDTFDITISGNNFPSGTTFQLLQSDGLTPMTDSNGNGIPDTGPVAIDGTYAVFIEANLPSDAPNGEGPYNVTKVATSSFDDSVDDDAIDVLTTINGASVDLTNNAALGDVGVLGTGSTGATIVVTNSANPGTTTSFMLYVNNTGPSSDTFSLLADDDATFGSVNDMPSGWTVIFRDGVGGPIITNTGSIASLGSKLVIAEVQVPAGYSPGDVSVYFKAESPTSGALDTIRDVVSVNEVRAISIQTDNIGQTFPGGSVVYSHIVSNNGNVTEGGNANSEIAFSLGNVPAGNGWTTTIHYDADNDGVLDNNELPITGNLHTFTGLGAGLAKGTNIRLFVKVIAPLGASDGATLATTLTATTTNTGGSTFVTAAPAAVSNTDTTNVVRGDLTILKEQAISLDNNATLDTAFTTGQVSAPPGAAIVYRITVTNVGSSDATAISVNDTVPANTTFYTDATYLPTITGGSVANFSAPANGAAAPAAISFNVGTLTPTQTSVMIFRVLIDN